MNHTRFQNIGRSGAVWAQAFVFAAALFLGASVPEAFAACSLTEGGGQLCGASQKYCANASSCLAAPNCTDGKDWDCSTCNGGGFYCLCPVSAPNDCKDKGGTSLGTCQVSNTGCASTNQVQVCTTSASAGTTMSCGGCVAGHVDCDAGAAYDCRPGTLPGACLAAVYLNQSTAQSGYINVTGDLTSGGHLTLTNAGAGNINLQNGKAIVVAGVPSTTFAIGNDFTMGTKTDLYVFGSSFARDTMGVTNGAHSVGFKAPTLAASTAWTLPATDGTAGQVLKTDGAKNLGWATPTGGFSGSGTVGYVPRFSAATVLANSQIFDDGTNVGIGTATPPEKFSVGGDVDIRSSSNPTLSIYDTSNINGTESPRIRLLGQSGSWFWIDNTGNYLRLSSGVSPTNSTSFRLDASGNVTTAGSVGINKGANGFPLDIGSDGVWSIARFTVPAGQWGGMQLDRGSSQKWFVGMSDSAADNLLRFRINGEADAATLGQESGDDEYRFRMNGRIITNEFMVLPGAGAGKVLTSDLNGNATWQAPTAPTGMILNDGNAFGANATIGTNDSNALLFETNSLERMRIGSGGNIGIDDASPAALFTVGSGDKFQVDASGSVTTAGSITTSAGAVFDTDVLVVDATNNRVGIGTATPANKLDVVQTFTGTMASHLSAPTGSIAVTDSRTMNTKLAGVQPLNLSIKFNGNNNGILMQRSLYASVDLASSTISANSYTDSYAGYFENAGSPSSISYSGITFDRGGIRTSSSGSAVNNYGVYSTASGGNTNYGVYAQGTEYGVYASATGANGKAGHFAGPTYVGGTLTVASSTSTYNTGGVSLISASYTNTGGFSLDKTTVAIDGLSTFSGTLAAANSLYNIGVRGIADSTSSTVNGTELAMGGYFSSRGAPASQVALNKYGVWAESSGTAAQNVGVYGSASGGTTNYAGYFNNGNVYVRDRLGVGTSTPANKVDVVGDASVSGSLGVGTTTPGWKLDVNSSTWGAGRFKSTSDTTVRIESAGNYSARLILASDNGRYWTTGFEPGGPWVNAYTFRYFDGASSVAQMYLDPGTQTTTFLASSATTSTGVRIQLGPTTPTTNTKFIYFLTAGASAKGSITGNGAGGVQYNTTSDARLKENIRDYSGGLDVLGRLRVRSYDFKGVGKDEVGFIAQELYGVYPGVVSVGGEDPKNEPWMVDYGRLTPVIVSSVQELNTKVEEQAKTIDSLEARLEELEQKLR